MRLFSKANQLKKFKNFSTLNAISKKGEDIIKREKQIFSNLLFSIKRLEYNEEDIDLLKKKFDEFEELFLIVIVGEFNSGKRYVKFSKISSFLNALLGDKYMKEGVIPTTTNLHVIRYGDHFKDEFITHKNQNLVEVPVGWLKGLILVDTPGTNAIYKEHQAITEHFIPRSDLVLFITSSERPFSESEKEFLKHIKEWGKKVVVILNKIDVLKENDRKVVEEFVKKGITDLLEFTPEQFSVSSKETLFNKLENKGLNQDWKNLEDYIFKMLKDEKLKIKLTSPIGVCEKLIEKYLKNIKEKLNLLSGDQKIVEMIDSQLQLYEEDIKKDFRLFEDRLQNIFFQLIQRADKFFDDQITIGNIKNLKKDLIKTNFQKYVIDDIVEEISKYASSLIDFLIDRKYKQHKSINDFITKKAEKKDLVGNINSDFQFNRQELILKIQNSSENIMKYKNENLNDYERINNEITSGIYNTIGVQLGAIGIGTLSHILLPTLAMELTGILAGLSVGVLGLYVLPMKRNKLKREFRENVMKLNEKLKNDFKAQFDQDVAQSTVSIKESISPFSRFVRSEYEKHDKDKTNLISIHQSIDQIRKEIETTNFREETNETNTFAIQEKPLEIEEAKK